MWEEIFCAVEYTKVGRATTPLTQPVEGRGCTTAGGSSISRRRRTAPVDQKIKQVEQVQIENVGTFRISNTCAGSDQNQQ